LKSAAVNFFTVHSAYRVGQDNSQISDQEFI